MLAGAENLDMAGARSVLSWWSDAGFDTAIDESPRDWLSRAAPVAATAPAAPAADALPDTIEALDAWIERTAILPDGSQPGRRFRAEGEAKSSVMVMIDGPEAADAAPGPLMADDAGVLFGRMLAAIGLSRESIYLAPLMFARPMGRQVDQAGLAAIALRRIALARPKRLLILGTAASRALNGMEIAQARGQLRSVNHDGVTISAITSFAPRFLIQQPARKADAWRDLRLLIGGLES